MFLTPLSIEEALRNSGYKFDSHITTVELISIGSKGKSNVDVYRVTWTEPNAKDLVSFCDCIFISMDNTGKLYGDV